MPSNSLPDADLNLPEMKTKSPSCPAEGVHMYDVRMAPIKKCFCCFGPKAWEQNAYRFNDAILDLFWWREGLSQWI